MSKLDFRASDAPSPAYPTRQEFLRLKRRGGRRITVTGLGVLLLSSCSGLAEPPLAVPDAGPPTTVPNAPLAGGAPYDPDASYLPFDAGEPAYDAGSDSSE